MAAAPGNPVPQSRFESSCEGKEQHASEPAARAALKFYQQRVSLRTGGGLHPYKCDFCPFWHLGHGTRQDAPGRFGGWDSTR